MAVIAATFALLAGCGDDASDQTSSEATPAGALITYTRSGGIAATTQHLVIQDDGSATVRVEGPGGIGGDFRLSGAELERLRTAIDDATLEGDAAPTGCADCYSYEIAAGGRAASFDETQVPPGTQHLVSLLEGIVERETPSGPARSGA